MPPSSSKFKYPTLLLKCTLINGKPCEDCENLTSFLLSSVENHEKLAVLCRKVNARHDTLSNRLPVELIENIFGHFPDCSGYTASVYADPRKMISTSPFRITSVCSRWRDIGFSTTALWSSLIISVRSGDHARCKIAEYDLVRLWLARSGSRLLKLRIYVEQSAVLMLQNFPPMNNMVSLITPHTHRWDTLIVMMKPYFFLSLFEATFIEAPFLYHFEMDAYIPHSLQFTSTLKSGLLTVVSLSRVDFSKSRIDWTNVTEFSVEYRPLTDIVPVLGAAQNLRRFRCVDIAPSPPLDDTANKIVVNHSLQALELVHFRYSYSPFLRCLCFPNLSELTVDAPSDLTELEPWQDILSMVQTSKCQIKQLSLLQAHITPASTDLFIRMLQAMPSLERLHVSCRPTSWIAGTITSHMSPLSIDPLSNLSRMKHLELEQSSLKTDILLTILTEFLNGFAALPSVVDATPPKPRLGLRLVLYPYLGSVPLVVTFKMLQALLRAKSAAAEHVEVTVIQRILKNGTFHDTNFLQSNHSYYGPTK